MKENRSYVTKYISILYRTGQIFFDKKLKPYGIGCGQHVFILRIHENPGISILGLAQKGCYDNATATRAVKKLEQKGYIKIISDTKDKRIKRLYVTEKAQELISFNYEIKEEWMEIIMKGMDIDKREKMTEHLKSMSEYANEYLSHSHKEE